MRSVKTSNMTTKNSYRPEIDGLRAFAVIAVIINHLDKNILPSGYLGVDIFFVISGFVITSSLYKRPSKNFKDFISGFYERRIKRLVPALSVFVIIASISICLFNPKPVLTLRTGLTSLFGLSNLYLLKQSTNYFAQSTALNIFTHTWSLGVEEQFYLLFPFLIWFSGFGKQTKKGIRNLFLTISGLTTISLISFLYFYSTNQPAAYFLMPTRFWEMASGCLLFIGILNKSSIMRFFEKVPPSFLMVLIIGVMYLPISFARTSTFAVILLTLALINSLKENTIVFKILTNPKVVYVGIISYSLYLWHWGVLSISRWTIGIHWWSIPFQIVLIFCLSILSYKWIETPFRKNSWTIFLSPNKIRTFFIGFTTILATAISIVGITKYRNLLYLPGLFKISDRFDWKNNDCYAEKIKKLENPIQHCLKVKRSIDRPNRFFLMGDSHAAQYVFMANEVFKDSSYEVASLQTGRFLDQYVRGISNESFDELKEISKLALSGDMLAISFHRGIMNKSKDSHVLNPKDINKLLIENAFQRLKEPLQDLKQRGVRIIFIRDVPLLSSENSDITTCLMQEKIFGRNVCDVSHAQDTLTRSAQDILYDKLSEYIGIETWDPRKYMISDGDIYKVDDANDNIMMMDLNHITKSYSELLSKYFISDVLNK